MKKKILLVEDDPVLGQGVKINIELEGYFVDWSKNLLEATTAITENCYDLILLDLGLPDGSGLDFCKEYYQTTCPIIILTAQTDENSVVQGFDHGATDYVRKPFGTRELHSRIKAHLKNKQINSKMISFYTLQLNLESRFILYKNREILLNRRRFDLLVHLVRNSGMVINRESLINVLGMDEDIIDRTIDVHVSQLRRDLKKNLITDVKITSVYGIGYRLDKV